MPVSTTQFGHADLSKKETGTEPPMRQLGRAPASSSIDHVCFTKFSIFVEFQLIPVGTAQFGQADLSKTETDTEAPMTQLERAAASSLIIAHVSSCE